MPPLRDIRDHIPKTAQTDPNKFPLPDYQRYPLMATGADNKPLLDNVGQPVIFHSQEEEDAYYVDHPEHEKSRHVDPENVQDELTRLRAKLAEYETADEAKTTPETKKDDGKGVAGLVKDGGKGTGPKPGSKLE